MEWGKSATAAEIMATRIMNLQRRSSGTQTHDHVIQSIRPASDQLRRSLTPSRDPMSLALSLNHGMYATCMLLWLSFQIPWFCGAQNTTGMNHDLVAFLL
jgi:hypothetical protein